MKRNNIVIEKIWLTVADLQKYLGFANEATQREWREKGSLPYYTVGRVILYRKDEIDDFVRRHKQF